MKHVLKVLNRYIGSTVDELRRKDSKIKELWNDNCKLKEEIKMLRDDLAELSREQFKK